MDNQGSRKGVWSAERGRKESDLWVKNKGRARVLTFLKTEKCSDAVFEGGRIKICVRNLRACVS